MKKYRDSFILRILRTLRFPMDRKV